MFFRLCWRAPIILIVSVGIGSKSGESSPKHKSSPPTRAIFEAHLEVPFAFAVTTECLAAAGSRHQQRSRRRQGGRPGICHHFTAPTERTPSRGPASNGH